jgi:hypothetical protein
MYICLSQLDTHISEAFFQLSISSSLTVGEYSENHTAATEAQRIVKNSCLTGLSQKLETG